MRVTALLIATPGVIQSHHCAEIARLLDCDHIIRDWDGRSMPAPGTLAITSNQALMPRGMERPESHIYAVPNSRTLHALLEDLNYRQCVHEAMQRRA